jgi:seryl-tRNA synthetase
MIDISLLRSNDRLFFKKQILLKEPSFNIEKMLELDTKLREIRACVEELQATKNKLSKIKGAPSAEIKEKSISVGLALKEKTENLNILTAQFEELALRCPNIPHADVPPGDKESNKIVKSWEKSQALITFPKTTLNSMKSSIGLT